MHDVHRDSLIPDGRKKKAKKSDHVHGHENNVHSHDHDHGHAHAGHDHDHDHNHDHGHHDHTHGHDHDDHDHAMPHGHDHDHPEDAYAEHERDHHVHGHGHEHGETEDRAFAHLHEHGHDFFHAHHHTHHPEHAGVVHRILNDPVRDWFAVFLMLALIAAGYFRLFPGYVSEGMLICAAVMGVFPLLKNGFFALLYRRKFCFELPAGVLLLAGLFTGRLLEVALIALLLVVGSFMRLNFSWKE